MENLVGLFPKEQGAMKTQEQLNKEKVMEAKRRAKIVADKNRAELAGRAFIGECAGFQERETLRTCIINRLDWEAERFCKKASQICALDMKKYFDEYALGEGNACKVARLGSYDEEKYLMGLKAVANLVKPGNKFDLQFGEVEIEHNGVRPMIKKVTINAKRMETTKTHHSYKIAIYTNNQGQRFIDFNICTRVPNSIYKK